MIVRLNVYDLHTCNDFIGVIGVGLYHSGVHLDNEEYAFGHEQGIFTHLPQKAPGATYRETVELGEYDGTRKDLELILSNLESKYSPQSYNLLYCNCNTFSNELVQCLLKKDIPDYINRLAYLGGVFSFLLPPSITNNFYETNSSVYGENDKLMIDNKQFKII